MRRRIAFVLCALAVLGTAPPASASETLHQVVSIELAGADDARFTIDGRRYAGPVVFTRFDDGLTFTERATIEQYLEGIAEVPFLWPEEALAAQAVAARTYLTRRLLGGRSGDERTYGYDICATSRCQVYRGVEHVEGDHGDRWKDAVRETEDVLILYDGRPIEAVYSSMFGSRSRANQDVWGSDPVPYLQPVDSPEEGIAPYDQWTIELSAAQFVEILRAGGLAVGGPLVELDVDDPPEGEGRTEITVVTERGTESILAPNLKGTFNRHGEDLYPGLLPARIDDDRTLPQALPSYTYEIEHIVVPPRPADPFLPPEDRIDIDIVRIDGEGWGHGVGMSQWGARIMADEGATYDEILSHYYSGVELARSDELVPDTVVVGLDLARSEIVVDVEGTAEVRVNGVPVGTVPPGTWVVRPSPAGIALLAADGLPGLPFLEDRPWPR